MIDMSNWNVIGCSMVVMPSNNSGIMIGRLCGLYPGRIGWLMSPGGWRKPPSWMPYALDNGAFGAWQNKKEWDQEAFLFHLSVASNFKSPRWVVVPDVVGEKNATLDRWGEWAPKVRKVLPQTPLAFAVQDGMWVEDVPKDADVIFVGGTTEWKWDHMKMWTGSFQHVHVARVNTEKRLWECHDAGAMSCDGTGWFRGGEKRLAELEHYLEYSSHQKHMRVFTQIPTLDDCI